MFIIYVKTERELGLGGGVQFWIINGMDTLIKFQAHLAVKSGLFIEARTPPSTLSSNWSL
jgi:hypothetical protein